MRSFKTTWLQRIKRIFKHRLKPYLVDGKYKVIPAFSIGGTDYWMFESTNEVPTGRFFAAMGVYAEMEMNCNKEYLQLHCKAMEKLLSDPKKISIQYILQLNINLKERLELMPFPDYIYKLASVIFFDKTESLYSYDYEYAATKIKFWKDAGGGLDFFCNTPLKELVPSLTLPEKDTLTYLTVSNLIAETHRRLHSDILQEG
jgi:hypothetical protein